MSVHRLALSLLLLGTPSALAAPAGPPTPSVHATHQTQFGALAPFPRSRLTCTLPDVPTTLPTQRVYGYLAYWDDDPCDVPWDSITDLAVFSAEAAADGTLSHTDRWDAASDLVAIGAPYGVRIDLCVTQFSTSTLRNLLNSATARTTLVNALSAAVSETGANGVNLDFEGVPSDARDGLVTLVEALSDAGLRVSLAAPAIDWSGAWDMAALDDHADIFIMGYAYHWSSGPTAGPVDPLYGGGPWASYSQSKSVQTYLDQGVNPDRLILGLALYGARWPVASGDDSLGASTTGTGSAVLYAQTADESAPRWDSTSHTPWLFGGDTQTWFANHDSVIDRVDWVVAKNIGGVGFWALNYDDHDDALWADIRERTRRDPPPDNPEDTDAGSDSAPSNTPSPTSPAPRLVYPGDTVILSLDGAQAIRWKQVLGPSVKLQDANPAEPSFVVPAPGAYRFRASLADGQRTSRWFIAIDRTAAGTKPLRCGYVPSRALGVGALLVLSAALRRRSMRAIADHDHSRR